MTITGLLRNLLPRPWTALWLWLTWLLLNQSVALHAGQEWREQVATSFS
jgi:hypothetical protein